MGGGYTGFPGSWFCLVTELDTGPDDLQYEHPNILPTIGFSWSRYPDRSNETFTFTATFHHG